jgi:hypothetical protein
MREDETDRMITPFSDEDDSARLALKPDDPIDRLS